MRLLLAAADDAYYREHVAAHVDGRDIVYVGEADFETKVKLYGGARALLYPVQAGEPFGLVMAEAMACGTPVAALDRGAVREVVDDGLTGIVFDDIDQMAAGLERVLGLDRHVVRREGVKRFGVDRMVDEYVAVYRRIAGVRPIAVAQS
jgi:glycosyltransferase involved in cell wall biosynthesis